MITHLWGAQYWDLYPTPGVRVTQPSPNDPEVVSTPRHISVEKNYTKSLGPYLPTWSPTRVEGEQAHGEREPGSQTFQKRKPDQARAVAVVVQGLVASFGPPRGALANRDARRRRYDERGRRPIMSGLHNRYNCGWVLGGISHRCTSSHDYLDGGGAILFG